MIYLESIIYKKDTLAMRIECGTKIFYKLKSVLYT